MKRVMPRRSRSIPVLRRLYLFSGTPILVVAVAVAVTLPMIRGRVAFATALFALAVVFVVAAIQYVRLRAKLRGLRARVVESGWSLCLECGYSFAGGGEDAGVCPECGKPYRLAEVQDAWRAVRFRSP